MQHLLLSVAQIQYTWTTTTEPLRVTLNSKYELWHRVRSVTSKLCEPTSQVDHWHRLDLHAYDHKALNVHAGITVWRLNFCSGDEFAYVKPTAVCCSALLTTTEQKVFVWRTTPSTNILISYIFTAAYHTYKYFHNCTVTRFQEKVLFTHRTGTVLHSGVFILFVCEARCTNLKVRCSNRTSPRSRQPGQLLWEVFICSHNPLLEGGGLRSVTNTKRATGVSARKGQRLYQMCVDSAAEATVNCLCRHYLERVGEDEDILIYDLEYCANETWCEDEISTGGAVAQLY